MNNTNKSNSILVIGDSHTRSYSFNDNFIPMFVGQGKEYNFVSDENYQRVEKSIHNILSAFDNQLIMLVFCEPDTRYYLGKGWNPWDVEGNDNINDLTENIKLTLKRYSNFIDSLKQKFTRNFFICNITPSLRENQNKIVFKLNTLLKELCKEKNVEFIDLEFEKMPLQQISEMMGEHVHMNNKVQNLVEDWLIKRGYLVSSKFNSNTNWDNKDIHSKFMYNEKFGCYTLNNETEMKQDFILEQVNCEPVEINKYLNKFGVVVIPNFCNMDELNKLKEEFHSILSGKHQDSQWFQNRPYSLGVAALLSRNDMMKNEYPFSFKFFSNQLMQSITDEYLGKGFQSNQKIFVVKDVVGNSHHANDLHFDVQRTLKFFLYLGDTTAKNGAFCCVPGSHLITDKIRKENSDKISYENREFSRMLPYNPEDIIAIEAKAGSLIIFDTDVFHKAGKVTEGERWVMRGQSEPVPSTIPKHKQQEQTLFQKIKYKFFK